MIKDSGRELDMRNPEQRPSNAPTSLEKKGVFPFATTVGRAASKAPTIEVPEVKKRPEPIQPKREALIIRLAGALLALAGTAGPAVHHQINSETQVNLPAVKRDIASIPGFYWNFGKSTVEDIYRLFKTKELAVPPTFDSNKTEIPQYVQLGTNTTSIENDQQLKQLLRDSIKPFENIQTPNVSILFPVELDGNQPIGVTTHVDYSKNPTTGEKEASFINKWIDIKQKNSKIIIPVEGAEIFQLPPWVASKSGLPLKSNTPHFQGVQIKFPGENGKPYILRIDTWYSSYASEQPVEDVFKLMDIAKNAPIWNDNVTLQQELAGLSLPIKTPIIETLADNLNLTLSIWEPQTRQGFPPTMTITNNFDFLTISADENQQHIVVVSKQISSQAENH